MFSLSWKGKRGPRFPLPFLSFRLTHVNGSVLSPHTGITDARKDRGGGKEGREPSVTTIVRSPQASNCFLCFLGSEGRRRLCSLLSSRVCSNLGFWEKQTPFLPARSEPTVILGLVVLIKRKAGRVENKGANRPTDLTCPTHSHTRANGRCALTFFSRSLYCIHTSIHSRCPLD